MLFGSALVIGASFYFFRLMRNYARQWENLKRSTEQKIAEAQILENQWDDEKPSAGNSETVPSQV
jgi:hypothetical protein